jgi:hypothetical protein
VIVNFITGLENEKNLWIVFTHTIKNNKYWDRGEGFFLCTFKNIKNISIDEKMNLIIQRIEGINPVWEKIIIKNMIDLDVLFKVKRNKK